MRPATEERSANRWPRAWIVVLDGKVCGMQKMSLTAMVREQLVAARSASSGRSARTVFGGHERVLRQTVIAMVSGQVLDEHDSPGEATLHVLHGRVRLATTEASWDGSPGDLLIIPQARHSLTAREDAAVLFTVAKIG